MSPKADQPRHLLVHLRVVYQRTETVSFGARTDIRYLPHSDWVVDGRERGLCSRGFSVAEKRAKHCAGDCPFCLRRVLSGRIGLGRCHSANRSGPGVPPLEPLQLVPVFPELSAREAASSDVYDGEEVHEHVAPGDLRIPAQLSALVTLAAAL